MEKKNFISLIMETVGGILFAIGMCMCLLPQWNAFNQGVVISVIGLVVLLIMLLVRRKLEGKPVIVKLSARTVGTVLLGIIGGNMIREALSKDEDKFDGSLAFKTMLLLAIATSIDALAVGITFAFLPGTRIVPAVALIGSITFVFSAAGIRLGNVFGLRYKRKAEFAGGVILILLGTKILLEHLGVL